MTHRSDVLDDGPSSDPDPFVDADERGTADVVESSPTWYQSAGRWLRWQAVTVGSVAALVVFVYRVSDRFFYAGDKQNQYLPVARDIGYRQRAGEWLPVIDPDLGRSGNYALDLQYGVFEPTHRLTAIALSYVDNLALAATLWAAAYLALLAAGVCALLLRLKVAGGWAAATAVGVAASGYLLFWAAPSWIPALVSVAWVPWWWWAAVGSPQRAWRLVASGLLAFLICAGGWPATWLLWGFLVVGFLAEAVVRRAEPGVLRATLLHVLASAGGGMAALVTVLPLQRAVDFTSRETESDNNGFLVPNLADILGFSSPALHGDLDGFGSSYPQQAPLFFGVWFVAVLVWLVPWRRAVLARPAFVASLVGLLLTLLFTQAASNLGPLRWPIRMVPGVPLFLGVGVAVALASLGLRLSRGRVVGAVASLLAVTVLTFFRDPTNGIWLPAGLVTLAAAALLLVAVAHREGRFSGLAALLATVVMAGWAVAQQPHTGMADRGSPTTQKPGTLVLDDKPTVTLYPEGDQGRNWAPEGVAPGFIRLSQTQRTQPGYSSIGQQGWDDRFCNKTAHSFVCPAAAEKLQAVEPRTQRRWVDLLGYQDVVVHNGEHLARWTAATAGSDVWQEVGRSEHFVQFTRRQPLDVEGRVTAVIGDASVEAITVERSRQSYDVTSEAGATLVFRDFFWPGYIATLDGERVPVRPLGRTLVTVEVPPGSDGTLTVSYEPLPTKLWAGPIGAGALVIGLAVLLALPWPRRRGRGGTPGSASPGS